MREWRQDNPWFWPETSAIMLAQARRDSRLIARPFDALNVHLGQALGA
jgi:hypothetical protein